MLLWSAKEYYCQTTNGPTIHWAQLRLADSGSEMSSVDRHALRPSFP